MPQTDVEAMLAEVPMRCTSESMFYGLVGDAHDDRYTVVSMALLDIIGREMFQRHPKVFLPRTKHVFESKGNFLFVLQHHQVFNELCLFHLESGTTK